LKGGKKKKRSRKEALESTSFPLKKGDLLTKPKGIGRTLFETNQAKVSSLVSKGKSFIPPKRKKASSIPTAGDSTKGKETIPLGEGKRIGKDLILPRGNNRI